MRLLITRYYPRGIKKGHFDDWVRVLSPSPALLLSYKDGKIDWETFKQKFLDELSNNIDSIEVINILHDEMRTDAITLLCFEKSGKHCHRHFVRDIIENPKKLYNRNFIPQYADNDKGIPIPSLITH